jgi:tripartite-type tricarboxylate transporter receptor subunit TctC
VHWPRLPDVPTMVESGFPDFTMVSYSGVLAPVGTPPAVVRRLNAAINAGLRSPAAAESLEKFNVAIKLGLPEDFAAHIRQEGPKWVELVELSGAAAQ